MINMSLVFPVRFDTKQNMITHVLLGLKKRGHRKGCYNGFGGKIQHDEQIIECAARELKEESGLSCDVHNLYYNGNIEFVFPDSLVTDAHVHFFTTAVFSGLPEETDEMVPSWFSIPDALLAMDTMDRLWMPALFTGFYFEGSWMFDENNEPMKGGFKWENNSAEPPRISGIPFTTRVMDA